ncbi:MULTISPECIES: hypothetical protein [Kocuria]|uniref:Uncharacterized protein n=1 Tax=Kocuria subflava TaxID=1736139 RepID=A0A846TLU4_9MICC|nr:MULTISPECIES: hypothetical protein [Kocuria]NKE10158.1 hypothetical protein [Kocuria subflava]
MNQLNHKKSAIKGYNLVSVAVLMIGAGVMFTGVSVYRDLSGFDIYAVVAGIFIAAGLSGLYLGLQWDRKTPFNSLIAIVLAIFGSLVLPVAIAAI